MPWLCHQTIIVDSKPTSLNKLTHRMEFLYIHLQCVGDYMPNSAVSQIILVIALLPDSRYILDLFISLLITFLVNSLPKNGYWCYALWQVSSSTKIHYYTEKNKCIFGDFRLFFVYFSNFLFLALLGVSDHSVLSFSSVPIYTWLPPVLKSMLH